MPEAGWTDRLQDALLRWYGQCARDLPWRRTRDPYAIWISEIMLQQTQVDTVIPYYDRFLAALPTVAALAEVPEPQLMKLWEGLGYYSRARNLQKAARQILAHHEGQLPQSPAALRKLSGIGPYTAGAIASIAFGIPAAAVDGNVIRVYSRLCAVDADSTTTAGKALFEALGQQLVASRDPSAYNQAVMELGALVCSPLNPRCGLCPVADLCRGRAQGNPEAYPVKTPKAPAAEKAWQVMVYRHQGDLFLMPRTEKGLLKGLWGFPMGSPNESAAQPPLTAPPLPLGAVRHIFTHQVWNMTVLLCACADRETLEALYPEGRWLSPPDLETLPIATAFRKVLRLAAKADNSL